MTDVLLFLILLVVAAIWLQTPAARAAVKEIKRKLKLRR